MLTANINNITKANNPLATYKQLKNGKAAKGKG